jgi:kinesin family protein 18/19
MTWSLLSCATFPHDLMQSCFHATRSHAVLEITVKRKQRNKYRNQVLRGKLALVDLAGSERASETNSGGQKLRDGANINRSLLALANCINALGKQQKKGLAYVPYRNRYLMLPFFIIILFISVF